MLYYRRRFYDYRRMLGGVANLAQRDKQCGVTVSTSNQGHSQADNRLRKKKVYKQVQANATGTDSYTPDLPAEHLCRKA